MSTLDYHQPLHENHVIRISEGDFSHSVAKGRALDVAHLLPHFDQALHPALHLQPRLGFGGQGGKVVTGVLLPLEPPKEGNSYMIPVQPLRIFQTLAQPM
jgi:hypothetical protein